MDPGLSKIASVELPMVETNSHNVHYSSSCGVSLRLSTGLVIPTFWSPHVCNLVLHRTGAASLSVVVFEHHIGIGKLVLNQTPQLEEQLYLRGLKFFWLCHFMGQFQTRKFVKGFFLAFYISCGVSYNMPFSPERRSLIFVEGYCKYCTLKQEDCITLGLVKFKSPYATTRERENDFILCYY